MVEFGYTVLLGLAFALYVMVACGQPGSDVMGRRAWASFTSGDGASCAPEAGKRGNGSHEARSSSGRGGAAGRPCRRQGGAPALDLRGLLAGHEGERPAPGDHRPRRGRTAVARKPRMLTTIQWLLAHHFGNP